MNRLDFRSPMPRGSLDAWHEFESGSGPARIAFNKLTIEFALKDLQDTVGFLSPSGGAKSLPFFPIVVSLRDELKLFLRTNGVFATVHWPQMPGASSQATWLGSHSLSIPCDERYGDREIEFVAGLIRDFVHNVAKYSVLPSDFHRTYSSLSKWGLI
jgi:hypothetical protein